MKRTLRLPRMYLSAIRLAPHLIVLFSTHAQGLVRADIARWAEIMAMPRPVTNLDYAAAFIELMTFLPEYRTLFYFRCGFPAKLFSWLCPPLNGLEINSPQIGPGLFIQHGIGTLISAKSIGADCWINQQVTIGYSNNTDRPTIGDRVSIYAGAKIIGNVTIGDDAVIGLNTVVIDNVAPNVTVLGVPGRVISRGDIAHRNGAKLVEPVRHSDRR